MISYLVNECNYKHDEINKYENWEIRVIMEREQREPRVRLFDEQIKVP